MPLALIIDDEYENRQMLKSYMQLYDVDTIDADFGQEGFELAKDCQPNLIFTDLRMPEETWNGYKTIAALKNCETTRHIPIVAVTASGDLYKAQGMGCDDFLLRPFRTRQLQTILSRYINIVERPTS